WTQVWTNGATFDDAAWTLMQYDIWAVADNQPTVFIRFELGDTDGSVTYEGWNIDDITVRTSGKTTVFVDDFEDGDFSDWTLGGGSNDWEIGTPGGLGSPPDPSAAANGLYSIGNDLTGLGAVAGEYENDLPLDSNYIISPAINCLGYTGVTLDFMRWLGVESSSWDHAYVEVSNDGAAWTQVWTNGATMDDAVWVPVSYDISAVADDEATVYVRFELGDTDSSVTYEGWNLDDIAVRGDVTYCSLQHIWRTENVDTGADDMTLHVRARHNTGSNDAFTFGWATAFAGPYTDVITVNTDTMSNYNSGIIPVSSGPLYIRVIDDNSGDGAQQDDIIIDRIYIEWHQGIPLQGSLEHRWRTENVLPGSTLDLYVTANTNGGSDDSFSFGYSLVLGGPYTSVLTVPAGLGMATYSGALPAAFSGQFYLNVIDDNTGDAVQQDTAYVDTIRIEQSIVPGGGSNQVAIQDIPVEGTVTPPANGY
ncbi:MAG: hypothetical protein KAX31_06025, partial [Thermoplasmata archaeon]|nr:hypothetical protein [Thermoplasmata archaeon]